MPGGAINNPGGVWGETASSAAVDASDFINNSGGTLSTGDVVCSVDGMNVTTTTTANDKTVVGVVGASGVGQTATNLQTFAAGATVPVITRGPARINVGANTPAANDILTTTTTAKVAGTNAGAPAANAVVQSLIAVCLSATKDANNAVLAWINKA